MLKTILATTAAITLFAFTGVMAQTSAPAPAPAPVPSSPAPSGEASKTEKKNEGKGGHKGKHHGKRGQGKEGKEWPRSGVRNVGCRPEGGPLKRTVFFSKVRRPS